MKTSEGYHEAYLLFYITKKGGKVWQEKIKKNLCSLHRECNNGLCRAYIPNFFEVSYCIVTVVIIPSFAKQVQGSIHIHSYKSRWLIPHNPITGGSSIGDHNSVRFFGSRSSPGGGKLSARRIGWTQLFQYNRFRFPEVFGSAPTQTLPYPNRIASNWRLHLHRFRQSRARCSLASRSTYRKSRPHQNDLQDSPTIDSTRILHSAIRRSQQRR